MYKDLGANFLTQTTTAEAGPACKISSKSTKLFNFQVK